MRFVRNLTLEQFCLYVVCENLEKFIYSPDVSQKNIYLLHKIYGGEIFKRFCRKNTVTEDIMIWFLNPYSKKISLHDVTENITKHLQIIGSTIISLDFQESSAAETTMNSILNCVPNVTHLNLSKTDCTDNTLLCIKKMCPFLISLELFNCKSITDDGLEAFCDGNLTLKHINLLESSIEKQGLLMVLNKMPQLESLKYYDLAELFYEMTKSGDLRHKRYSLTEFFFNIATFKCKPTKLIEMWTFLCPNVNKVFINFAVSEKALQMCTQFQHLQDLEIVFKKNECDSGCNTWSWSTRSRHIKHPFYATNVLASLIPLANKLTALKLSKAEIDTKLLVEKFFKLKTLGLQKVTFTNFNDDEILLNENNLETLVVEDVDLNVDSNYKAIQVLLSLSKKVTKLRFDCSDLKQNSVDTILNSMKELSFVTFRGDVTVPSFLRFSEIPSMTTMYFYKNWCYSHSHTSRKQSYFESVGFRKVQRLYPTNSFAWSCWDSDDEDFDAETHFHDPPCCKSLFN